MPARVAAALSTDAGVSRAMTTKRGPVQRGNDAQFQATYMDWQGWARRYARQITAAQFSALVVSNLCARCDVRPEMRIDGSWEPIEEDPAFGPLMEAYRNPLQGPDELVYNHAWHYQVAGEMLLVHRDGPAGVEYGVYSTATAEWDKPFDGDVTIKLIPDGKAEKGTAFVVPRNQVVRFWMPDAEWQAYAWSPMAAAIDDLHRLRALGKHALKTADSAIAMSGLLWAPGEAFSDSKERTSDLDDDAQGTDAGTPTSPLEDLYYSIAGLRHSASEDVSSIAPPLFHWAKEYGKPEWVKMGEPLDPNGIAYRDEALTDFARGMPIPNTTIEGGGVGDANHWSEWLASDKMFDSAVAPTMDRITHLDLTRAFLWPRAMMAGYAPEMLANLRIGYDATNVIVQQDNSELSLRLYLAGLLGSVPALEACGYADTDKMLDEQERAWLLEVLAHGRLATQPATGPGTEAVTPATVTQGPPERPTTPSVMAAAEEPLPKEDASSDARVARRIVGRVTRLRQQLGTKLLADARLAYDDAMQRAGVNLTNRARNRAGAKRQAEVRQAVAGREPLAPLCAAVGLREDELLRHAFDTFRDRALDEFRIYRERVTTLVTDANLDVDVPTEADATNAVDYLVASLTSAVRGRLLSGDAAAVTAAAPSMIPRARRRPPSGGDILPGLPDPDELSQAAARFTRNALRIHEQTATFTFPPTPDQPPTVVDVSGAAPIEERIVASFAVVPTWTWAHGFYGEPNVAFEPHDDLDGFSTTTIDADPDLYNGDAWPEADLFSPGDHDGCTCEWVLDVVEPEDVAPEAPRHQSTREVIAQARERVAAGTG